MERIIPGRMSADHAGEIVLHLVGLRINRWLAVQRWRPALRALGAVLKELRAEPVPGLLGAERLWRSPRQPLLLQYWRSFDALEAHGAGRCLDHLGEGGAVGVFHETYVVRPGCGETLYVDMPPSGLGRAAGLVPALGDPDVARDRMAQD